MRVSKVTSQRITKFRKSRVSKNQNSLLVTLTAVASIIAAISTALLASIATYAAFYSPLSDVIEAQLRTEIATSNKAKATLEESVSSLRNEKSTLEEALESEGTKLEQIQLKLSETKRELRDLNNQLDNVRIQSGEAKSQLVSLYEEQFLSSLPGNISKNNLPYALVEIFNSKATGENFDPEISLRRIYTDQVGHIEKWMSDASTSDQLLAVSNMESKFRLSCPTAEAHYTIAKDAYDNLYSEEEANEVEAVFNAFEVTERICFIHSNEQ